jgi:hypothetical protein
MIKRASEWSGEARRSVDAAPGPHGPGLCEPDLRVHCAVVGSVPPATCGQARVSAAVDQGRERPQTEEQDKKNGEAALHLKIMLAEAEHRRSVMTME